MRQRRFCVLLLLVVLLLPGYAKTAPSHTPKPGKTENA